jgi:hypothetical protein
MCPAPKFNLYALGNNGGRERIFATPEELEAKVIEYFNWCVETKTEIAKNGLELFIGFNSRSTWSNYMKREEYLDILNRAKKAVVYSYELDLRSFKFGGAIFALKNLDPDNYVDKVETENKSIVTNVTASFNSTVQSPSESADDSRIDS